MHEAQDILLKSMKVTAEHFVALPTGSGATGAIEKAIKLIQNMANLKNPTIFITPYEHHSNILPWV